MRTTNQTPVGFDRVRAAEARIIKSRRRARNLISDLDDPIGLSLSGGGIRSAATCLGAIQALSIDGRFQNFDYVSTVSGGGYTGACLSAAMSKPGGGEFPFGADVKDSPVVAHIRNYSNYLLPRNRSAVRNWSEVAAILARGLLANAICVLAFVFLAAAITVSVFRNTGELADANFVLRLLTLIWSGFVQPTQFSFNFILPLVASGAFAIALTAWAVLRTWPRLDGFTSDTSSKFLTLSAASLGAAGVLLFLDLQPLAIKQAGTLHKFSLPNLDLLGTTLAAFGTIVSALASTLGKFLETSKRSNKKGTIALRGITSAAIFLAALVLPLLIWASYVLLCARVLAPTSAGLATGLAPHAPKRVIWIATGIFWAIMLGLRSNGYSLHRLYRDRLSKAFLVSTAKASAVSRQGTERLAKTAAKIGDLPPLDAIKLSALRDSLGPYPLINAALNLQGSLAANKRGRNADFFVFTPHYVGSELTGFAKTDDVEAIDSRVDLASAMAISGAAASANMGGNTVRALSPTLSLLNIRLGYYLKNPRYFGEVLPNWRSRLRVWFSTISDRFYLFIEMFNGLTEKRRHVYLTDGGHIENLGVYALLQRRCRLIFAIDAEADPDISCESLLKLERYARIDLGIRMVLPWEAIRRRSQATSDAIPGHDVERQKGPHIAVGRIFYPDGEPGIIVYTKSSLSGDEKDYILDYAERNPSFPHETTGDQFFSEEQFEMYRALGFHMVDGLFKGDHLAFLEGEPTGFADENAVLAAVLAALPKRGSPTEDK